MMVGVTNKRSVMTLYANKGNLHSHRVKIVLAEKGVTYEVVYVNGSAKIMDELCEYNPYALVPTLVDRDLVLYQSEVIMEYLDERFPHPPLMPVYPVARGRSRLMIHRINNDWYPLMEKLLMHAPNNQVDEKIKRELTENLLSIADVFAEMPFFMSEEFSLVDCCILPLLWQLPKVGIRLPSSNPIKVYADRMFKRESFQTSILEEDKL
jgi:RNA polymerase-associated protein